MNRTLTPHQPTATVAAILPHSDGSDAVGTHRYTRGMSLVEPEPDIPAWTFLTNHAHVLIAIDRKPDLRQRDIAHAVGITVGAVQKIIGELEDAGYVSRQKVGRRNNYRVNADSPLRHPLESHHTVLELLHCLHPER